MGCLCYSGGWGKKERPVGHWNVIARQLNSPNSSQQQYVKLETSWNFWWSICMVLISCKIHEWFLCKNSNSEGMFTQNFIIRIRIVQSDLASHYIDAKALVLVLMHHDEVDIKETMRTYFLSFHIYRCLCQYQYALWGIDTNFHSKRILNHIYVYIFCSFECIFLYINLCKQKKGQ
jgi:hypothetical protein